MSDTNIKRIMNARGITPSMVAASVGLSEGTINNWMSGVYTPGKGNYAKLEALLQVPIDLILDLPEDKQTLLENYDRLTSSQKKALIELLKTI